MNIIEKEEILSLTKNQSRRNSIQPIDRHINDIQSNGTIYINAGIDSTWFVFFFIFINFHFLFIYLFILVELNEIVMKIYQII